MDAEPATASAPGASVAPSPHLIQNLPVLVLFPHNRCNCRCIMCDIWRIREVREISAEDLKGHLESLLALRVRWVVLSGGEPQLATDFAELSRLLRIKGMRVTLLTAGLLLESYASSVVEAVDDVIVSLDGPRETHDRIRRVPGAFDRLAQGIAALRRLRPLIGIAGRSTVQKLNCTRLRETVRAAKEIGLDRISFLAADLSSEAFNRPGGWTPRQQSVVALDSSEADLVEREIELLIEDHGADIEQGYIAESRQKLRRIVHHFRAHLGQCSHVAPRCNAPWVSTVIESDGAVRPCFFHRVVGNIHDKPLMAILNGTEALSFRESLDVETNPLCQRCVCSLYLEPGNSTSP